MPYKTDTIRVCLISLYTYIHTDIRCVCVCVCWVRGRNKNTRIHFSKIQLHHKEIYRYTFNENGVFEDRTPVKKTDSKISKGVCKIKKLW